MPEVAAHVQNALQNPDAAAVRAMLATHAPRVLSGDSSATVFWSGAGISADLPTGAPVGYALTDRVLESCFAEGTLQTLQCYYSRLRVPRSRPRLETVLDVVRRVYGLPVLADLLSDLRNPPANSLHRFFGAHLRAGGRHVTANFDPCIEAAGITEAGTRPVHFHGSFADDPTGEQLGATLARIERGLPADISQAVTVALTAESRLTLIFAGYSGSDFFDVDPYLSGLADDGVFKDATVLWIDHQDSTSGIVSGSEAAEARKQLAVLRRGGASVHQVSAPTRLVLEVLASEWQLPAPDLPSGNRREWAAAIVRDSGAREHASLELFALMGLHREVTGLLAGGGRPATADEWGIAAQSDWAAGRYRAAARAWQHAYPGNDAGSRAARAERQAACQWIRGQYNRAYRNLRRAVYSAYASGGEDVGQATRIQMAETLGRILVHMRRSPDSRLMATSRRRAFVLSLLPDPDITGQSPLGTHLTARVRSVRADLGAPAADAGVWEESQAGFAEYEALHARLNYRHAELRHEAQKGPLAASAYRQLREDFLVLGADGDAARVPLLPGAERAFSIRETMRGLRRIDISWWHRCRLLAGYGAKRALAVRVAHAGSAALAQE